MFEKEIKEKLLFRSYWFIQIWYQKKRRVLWKKLLETKESPMPLFPISSRWKTIEIAEMFNSYFVNIGPNLAASIPESKTTFQNYIHYDLSTINLMYLDLQNAFASLKTTKSLRYDDISADVVKKVSDEIFVILKHIFNISLVKGIFPDKLKIARVTAIFKRRNSTLVTNYRPISALPYFSKLLERIVYNCLYKFIVGNNILYQTQFGFQNAHSTEHAILQINESNKRSF